MNETKVIISGEDRTGPAIKSATAGLGALGQQAAQLQNTLGALGATAVAGVFGAMIKGSTDAADALNDMSQRTGIAVRDLGSYKLASEQSGASLDSIAKGVKALSVNLVDNAAAFKKVGVDTSDANVAFRQLSDLFAAMPDGVEKVALATKLFGKAGMDLIPTLNLGSQGLNDSADAAARYAAAMEVLAPQADKFNDSMSVLALASQTVGAEMANAVLPALNVVASSMSDAASNTGAFSGAATVLKTAMESVIVIGANVAYVFKAIGTEIGGMAAQANALAHLDFKQFREIGTLMKQDAEEARKAIDAFSEKVLNPPKIEFSAPVVDDTVKKKIAEQIAAFRELYKTIGDGKSKTGSQGLKNDLSQYYAAQIAAEKDFSATQVALVNARIDQRTISEEAGIKQILDVQTEGFAKQSQLLNEQLSKTKDAGDRSRIESQLKSVANSAQEAAAKYETAMARIVQARESAENARIFDQISAQQEQYESIEEATRAMREQTQEIGLNDQQLLALQQRRIDDQINMEQWKLSLIGGAEAEGAVADAIRATIAALEDRKVAMASRTIATQAKKAADDWEKASEKIENSITDALMRGFESGKGFAENLRDTVVNMFKTMVLRPVVQATVSGGMSALGFGGNAMAADGSAGGGFGGNNLLSNAQSLYSAYNWYSNGGLLSSPMYNSFASSSLGNSLGLSTAVVDSTGMNAVNVPLGWDTMASQGGGMSTLGAVGSTIGGMAAGYTLGQRYGVVGGLAGGLGTTALAGGLSSMAAGGTFAAGVAAIPVYGWILAAIAAIAGSMAKGGTPHAGGIVFSDGEKSWSPRTYEATQLEYANPVDAAGLGESDWFKRFQQGVADALTPTAKGIAGILNSASDRFGGGTDYKVGLAFSSDGEDKSRGRYSIIDDAGKEVFDWGSRKFNKDAQKGIEQFVKATGEGVVAVLKQMDLPKWAMGLVEDTGLKPTLEEAGQLVERLNAIKEAAERLSPALEMTEDNFAEIYLKAGDAAMTAYYTLVTRQSEQLADSYRVVSDAFDDLGFAVPGSIDGFRELITGLDETTEEGQKTIASLFQLSGAFGQVQNAIDSMRSSVEDSTLSLMTSSDRQAVLTRRLSDAAADAGVAVPRTVGELLRLAGSIDYTTEAGMRLALTMPTLANAFNAVQSSAVDETQASRIDEYLTAQRTAAIEAQQTVYANQISAAQDIADTFEGIADSLEEFKRSLLQSEKSTLSHQQQYAEAKRQFELTSSKARLGDVEAAENLESVISDFLDASKKVSANAADYAVDFGKSIAALDGVIGTASNQSGIANQQLAIAQAQLDALNNIGALLGSSGSQETAKLPLVVENFTQAMLDWEAWFANTAIGQTQSYDIGSTTRISNDKGIFTDRLGNSYVFSQSSGPYGLADQSSVWAEEMLKRYGQWNLPSFDVGTNYVPKDMVAMVHEGEAIVPRRFNPSIHGGSSNNKALVEEVKALREELKIALAVVANHTGKTAKTLDRVMPEGDALTVRIAA